ncbi:Glycosyltransferase involved in cell wall bisynthesis [Paenibacillus sp. yr247]|nr:Glycosyltransferase involved in cell wall bisynthesis [Paenibacillus sp. yr247]
MLIDRLKTGGTETFVLSLSKFLLTKGIRVGIVTKGGPLTTAARKMGISVHILPMQKEKLKNQIQGLYKIVNRNKYGLIHANTRLRLANRFQRAHPSIPLIVTVHSTYESTNNLRASVVSSKKIVSVSPRLSQWLRKRGIPAYKIQLIPNGINTKQFQAIQSKKRWRKALGLPQDAQLLVYAARFEKDKYPIAQKVILAAEKVARSNKKFAAVLYGPGPFRRQLSQLAQKVNQRLGRRVILVKGPLTSIQNAYYAADIVVGTGRVALEAMACARPVIAAGVSGYCGIVGPTSIAMMKSCNFGDHGSMISLHANRLVKDINFLLKHPQRLRTLGEFSSKMVRRGFSISKVGGQYIVLYRKFIKTA